MSSFEICKCGSLASWNSYFGGYYCPNCGLILDDGLPDGGRGGHMTKCNSCALRDTKPCIECSMCMSGDSHFRPIPNAEKKTNADRIRAKTDWELAAFLERVHVDPCSACCDNLYWCRRNNAPEPICKNHFLEWLQQPSEEDT